ncbi:hypothetical protein N9948_01745 [bacterium]|nr:hypothetical protein [bacterium]
MVNKIIKNKERWNQVVKAAMYLNTIPYKHGDSTLRSSFKSGVLVIKEYVDDSLEPYDYVKWKYEYGE